MNHYCIGFIFSPELDKVVLIQKCGPAWQCGKANGIGGKVECGESYDEAMRREAREELKLPPETQWHLFAVLNGNYEREDFELAAFACTSELLHDRKWRSQVILLEEPASVVPVAWVTALENAVPNLAWLVFMAHDYLKNGMRIQAEVKYK